MFIWLDQNKTKIPLIQAVLTKSVRNGSSLLRSTQAAGADPSWCNTPKGKIHLSSRIASTFEHMWFWYPSRFIMPFALTLCNIDYFMTGGTIPNGLGWAAELSPVWKMLPIWELYQEHMRNKHKKWKFTSLWILWFGSFSVALKKTHKES